MPNWKQELKNELIGIEDLNRNTAVLSFNFTDYDPYAPGGSSIKYIGVRRNLIVSDPKQVDARLVDGKNYIAGDLIVPVSFMALKKARVPLPDDPIITDNGVVITLEQGRPYNPTTCGVSLGIDTLTFGAAEYRIADIRAGGWLNDEPSFYNLTLRA